MKPIVFDSEMSCDTFVVVPPASDGCVIFGKNSDRPASEVQEVVYMEAADHDNGETVQCTYISIPQASHTHAVVLSKPAWMWGAEMGANEHGVCVGNEAVWTQLCDPEEDIKEKLLGMDLVRLALERGGTAREAVDVITGLLEQHGQGGPCYDDPNKLITYHNSFIIADGNAAWVLETAANHWAAQEVKGSRNLSNLLTIDDAVDLKSEGLETAAQSRGLWDPAQGALDFAKVFAQPPPQGIVCPGNEDPQNRYASGKNLLEEHSATGFTVHSMFEILRNKDGGICRVGKAAGSSVTSGSQVSVLYPPSSNKPSVHWFTATPNPACSAFKPFIFCPGIDLGSLTRSPQFSAEDDPAKCKPRFHKSVDRKHPLFRNHEAVMKPLPGENTNRVMLDLLQQMEKQCVKDVEEFVQEFDADQNDELKELFKDVVDAENKFYLSVKKE